jgi:CRP-like cAMP-binding protein
MITTLEKVIFLQEVDVFESLKTEDLAHLASIAEVLEFPANHVIFAEGGAGDSMYLVMEGQVRLHQQNQDVMVARAKDSFGTWSLFDDELRVVTATTLEQSRLLRVDKEDFTDLLADNVRITQGVMKSLVQRVRRLMGLANQPQVQPK